MKKIIFTLLLFGIFICNSYSQIEKAHNIIYLDFGIIFTGSIGTVGIGLNYERMISDNVSIRTGVNIAIFGVSDGGDSFSGTGISFPITVNYLTDAKNKFEIGIGGGPRISLESYDYGKIKLYPAARIGYRYQPEEKGMIYRMGAEFPANFYLSLAGIGYHF